MKSTKSMMVAVLVVSSLFAWSPALRAADTNTPPVTPPAGGPPTGAGQRPPGMRGPNVDQIAKELNLTDDQKAKVKTIFDTQQKKIAELRADTSLSPEDRRPKMQAIREETVSQMKTVLTPDQFEKWQTMNQRRRPGGPGGPGGPPPGDAHTNASPFQPK